MSADQTPVGVAPPRTPVWIVATIAGVFGLLYAYFVWNAVTLLSYQASGRLGLNGLGWFVLLFAAVFPLIVFAIAFGVGWRRRVVVFAAVLFTGLTIVGVFWLNILAYAFAQGASLLG
ncbi:bacitracin resistance protein [Microbacterium sp.]|mgnify:FL=1|uniref:bacitracin resistance protein n=1 Tax=Microbacterium sp. TaxID=51671 RepID=UPI001AC2A988|nr:bacitracin resistance protein [Microbacterium sp.]MBN9169245.1 bacitracin resistance protein [Microbacterium sp.]MBN9182378.1 bacitracin resistance protein [Microbacterium sp.]MBN9186100.1 bacitracin resistance protein [Microbacterium sp.]MBN9190131.1 bacitracin resistance protein [Microbacterium sp.]MBN9191566.1 bacitracin resistance protein [Microbacterium sp.]